MSRAMIIVQRESDRQKAVRVDRPPAEKHCAHCGVLFRRNPINTWAYWAKAKYCGRACFSLAWPKMAAAKRLSLEDKFFSNVQKGESAACWMWTAATDRDGYGMFSYGRKHHRAHRLSLRLSGVDVPKGAMVCHHCDTPGCVNPSHLYVGSPKENVRDAVERDRINRGEQSPSAKLTDMEVLQIRSSNETDADLAERFAVSRSNISIIRQRKTWTHLP